MTGGECFESTGDASAQYIQAMIRGHRPNEILELADLSTVVGTGALAVQIGNRLATFGRA